MAKTPFVLEDDLGELDALVDEVMDEFGDMLSQTYYGTHARSNPTTWDPTTWIREHQLATGAILAAVGLKLLR